MASTNDLTTRLRAMSRYAHDDLSIGDEAADVIERLRLDVHSCHADCSRAGCVNGRLREEIERMRPEVERLIDRVERLRGLAKTAVGMLRDAGREKATQWVDGALWGKMAETLTQYLVKGKLVCVTLDDVHIAEFEKRDGTAGTKLVGRVSKLELAGGREDGGQQQGAPTRQGGAQPRQQGAATRPAPAQRPASSGFDDMDDSDPPF